MIILCLFLWRKLAWGPQHVPHHEKQRRSVRCTKKFGIIVGLPHWINFLKKYCFIFFNFFLSLLQFLGVSLDGRKKTFSTQLPGMQWRRCSWCRSCSFGKGSVWDFLLHALIVLHLWAGSMCPCAKGEEAETGRGDMFFFSLEINPM